MVQVNQNGLEFNGAPQLLVYADDVNILGGTVHTVKKNREDSVDPSTETGVGVNGDETKYRVMSRD